MQRSFGLARLILLAAGIVAGLFAHIRSGPVAASVILPSSAPAGQAMAQTAPRQVVSDLVARAIVPVYGPAGNPFDLRLLTIAAGASAGGAVSGIQLLFGDFRPDGTRVALSVRSYRPDQEQASRVPADREAVLTGYNPYHDIYIDLQLDSRGAPRAYPTGIPEEYVYDVEIDGRPRAVSMACWSQDNGFCFYSFAVDGAAVDGGALGFAPGDLAGVLAGFQRLNDNPVAVSRYEDEYRAHGQAVAHRAGAGPRPADDPSVRHRLPIPARTRQSGGIIVSSFGGDVEQPQHFIYDIINLSGHFALMVEATFPFDGSFTIVFPPDLRPRVTFAAGITCREGEQPNTLACRMVEELVQLAFTAEPA